MGDGMRRANAATSLDADTDGAGIRSGADLKPCVMTPGSCFPERRING
jgi:hypothetical protein